MDEPRIIRIRMPADFKPYVPPKIEGSQLEPMTLAELNARMRPLFERTAKHWLDQQIASEKDREFWFGPIKPPTRWQKLSYPFKRGWENIKGAALVLIGKKEARDPYDD